MRTLVLALVLLGHARLGRADDAPARDAKPWAEGVAPETQARALEIFRDGNTLFLDSQYAPALELYREALALWDHPGIHFNIAVCLMNLEQPLAAADHLDQAMRWGEGGLAEGLYAQGVTFQKLLAARLSSLSVESKGTGAEIVLDGTVLFTSPGNKSQRLLPGAHQIIARKPGFATTTREVFLLPAQHGTEAIDVTSLVVAVRYVQRWKTRTPWLLAGSGVVAGLVGTGALLGASANYARFDDYIDKHCSNGCAPGAVPGTVHDLNSRGRLERVTGVVLVAGGGAMLAAGLVMVVLNQPRKVEPLMLPHGVGVSVHLDF